MAVFCLDGRRSTVTFVDENQGNVAFCEASFVLLGMLCVRVATTVQQKHSASHVLSVGTTPVYYYSTVRDAGLNSPVATHGMSFPDIVATCLERGRCYGRSPAQKELAVVTCRRLHPASGSMLATGLS